MIEKPELSLGSYPIEKVETLDIIALLNTCGAAYVGMVRCENAIGIVDESGFTKAIITTFKL